MAETTIRYGKGALALPPEAGAWPVLRAPGLKATNDPGRCIHEAATRAADKVAEDLPKGARLALVVPDRTRPLPLPELLPTFFDALEARGVPASQVSVVPASGMHRPMLTEELNAWVGNEVLRRGAHLAPHCAEAPALLLGWAGSPPFPVAGHPAVAGAGAVLVLGRIVYHYLAGFGGGRKMLVPGVAARPTILGVHAACLATRAGRGRYPCARAGRLEGNPVHEASCAAARLFPPTTAVHLLLTGEGQLSRGLVGDLFVTHAEACAVYATVSELRIGNTLDGVLVSAGGHPLDRDLVQAHKALDAVAPLVREGGTIIFAAECADGMGNEELREGLTLGEPSHIDAALRKDFRVGVHTALALAEKTRRFHVLALCDLPEKWLALAGMKPIASLEEGVSQALRRHGRKARFGVAPAGASYVYRRNDDVERFA